MLAPSAFVQSAGLPVQWKEVDLQTYIAQRLKERGCQVQMEVRFNGGRADIVTNWQGGAIIEVKKYLDRNTIYQAYGQLQLYGLKNQRKLIVMGFMSSDPNERQSALTTASMIQQDPRVQVIFVNMSEEWMPGSKVARRFNFSLPNFKLFSDWGWWFDFAKANPLLIVAVFAIFMGAIAPYLPHQEQNQTHVENSR